jgi:hypothetical protein
LIVVHFLFFETQHYIDRGERGGSEIHARQEMGDSRCERAMVDRHNVGQLHGLEPDGTHNVPTISQPSKLQFRPKTGAHFDA